MFVDYKRANKWKSHVQVNTGLLIAFSGFLFIDWNERFTVTPVAEAWAWNSFTEKKKLHLLNGRKCFNDFFFLFILFSYYYYFFFFGVTEIGLHSWFPHQWCELKNSLIFYFWRMERYLCEYISPYIPYLGFHWKIVLTAAIFVVAVVVAAAIIDWLNNSAMLQLSHILVRVPRIHFQARYFDPSSSVIANTYNLQQGYLCV